MQVYLSVCLGINELEIKLFSQTQWEDVIFDSANSNYRGSSPFNDAVLNAEKCLYRFTSLEPLLALARVVDVETVEEWNGHIY